MEELSGVKEVVIKFSDREIVLPEAKVVRTEMSGQRSYQVSGEEFEHKLGFEPTEDDIKLVMEQTGVERDKAAKALVETNGDIAEAILKLRQ